MASSRRSAATLSPEPEVEPAPVPDLLGSILTGQSLLMMSGSDVIINRDGSLTAKKALLHDSSGQEEGLEDGARLRESRLGTPLNSPNTDSPNSRLTLSNAYSSSSSALSVANKPVSSAPAASGRASVRFEYTMTPRSVQTQNLAHLNRCGPKLGEAPRFNGSSKLAATPLVTSSRFVQNSSCATSKPTHPRPPPKSSPKRLEISELPRIPKIKKEAASAHPGSQSSNDGRGDIPSSCITQLTGKGSSNQPVRGGKTESGKPNSDRRQAQTAAGGTYSVNSVANSTSTPSTRGKVGGTSFASFKINIPGNVVHSSRLTNPGFCNTFRPVDNKVQQKENPSPLFSLKKTKPVKSEIYDPFDPTGSDSSSANSSPERLPFTNITRTISVASSKVQTFQTVCRITPYSLENIFGPRAEASGGPFTGIEAPEEVMMKERIVEQIFSTEREKVEEEELSITPCTSSAIRQIANSQEDRSYLGIGFDEDEVKPIVKMEPASPIGENKQQVAKRSFSRSPSNSSSHSQKKIKLKKSSMKEYKCTQSKSRSRSRSRSCSKDRSFGSSSRSVEDKCRKTHETKTRTRESSSDHSSSHEHSKKKKDKDKDKKPKCPWPKEPQSHSPGSLPPELHESRKKKRHSSSRAMMQEYSQSSSTERSKKKKHRRERSSERLEKERNSRPQEKRRSRSREKRKRRSRSPSASRLRESKGTQSREKQPRSRSRSKERSQKPKEKSSLPRQQESQKCPSESPGSPCTHILSQPQEQEEKVQETINRHVDQGPVQDLLLPEGGTGKGDLEEAIAMDQTYERSANGKHPPQSESANSGVLPDGVDSSVGSELTVDNDSPGFDSQCSVKLEEIEIKADDNDVCPFLSDSVVRKEEELTPMYSEGTLLPTFSELGTSDETKRGGPLLNDDAANVTKPEPEVAVQAPVLKSKAAVKRVTWNLKQEESGSVTADKTPSVPFCKQQRMKENMWKAEDLTQTLNQVQLTEPPPSNCMIPEPVFPDLDPSQVYNQSLPFSISRPSGLPPYAPVSQPTVQFIMQGSLPLLSCGAAQGSTCPEPGNLDPDSEPPIQEASTGDAEEKDRSSKSPLDKTKNDEYMKKLHMQERAVEEVKLAIKPFYQKREITKEEYKDILRKAVQKICHSKSGEINPVKVANLVKAYVEKYKHVRKQKTAEGEEEPLGTDRGTPK